MTEPITVQFASGKPVPFVAPVPVVATVTNQSAESVDVLLPYPNPNNLRFRCPTQAFANPKRIERDPIERAAPIKIHPGQSYQVTYFLNRYFQFLAAGTGECDAGLRMMVTAGAEPAERRTYGGRFAVQLTQASQEEVRAVLAGYAAQLDSQDRKVKAESAEALAYLDTPLVIPHLVQMLHIENLEVIGIHALGRHPGRESNQEIPKMLDHGDSAVVGAALEEINRLGIPIGRDRVQRLLASTNPNIQWLALGWLAARPSREDIPLVSPLLSSPNSAVRDRAREYSNRLEEGR